MVSTIPRPHIGGRHKMFSELQTYEIVVLSGLVMLILTLLGTIAIYDAYTLTISREATAALALVSLIWSQASPTGISFWASVAGGVTGMAIVAVQIAFAEVLKRRWPIMPGDAWLLGAIGILLGPMGLAWTCVCALPLGLVYRFYFTRKRKRSFIKSFVPMAPYLCTATAMVFVFSQYEWLLQ